jgi:hypothetical protein
MSIRKIIKQVITEERLINEIGDYDMSMIKKYGGRVLDSINIQGYELALVDFGIAGKTISLTYNDKGYFQPLQQQKQPSEYKGSDIVKIFNQLKPKALEWVNKYKRITIGSTNESRVRKYHKWLCSDLKCTPVEKGPEMPHGESQYAFVIER